MKIKSTAVFAILFFLLMQGRSFAQPFNLDDNIQPVELTFTEHKKDGDEKAKGRISMNKLVQDKDTMYYFIKGLSMYSPTYFSLNSADAEADIKVNLCKENWKAVHHSGTVKGKSIWKNNFKTEGDFGIMVVANKKPAKYVLLVWTGEEMKIDMPSVFKGGDAAVAGSSSGGWFKKNMLVVLLGIAALAVIGFLLYKLKSKKTTA